MAIPKINSAHGSDTRNIINAAIDLINAQGKSIQDLVAEGQLTPEQYAELIQTVNGMVKSGQIDKSDLSLNLKTELDEFDSQLAQKAPKDETALALIALDAKIDGREPPEPINIENLWILEELVDGLLSTTSGNLNPSSSMVTTPFIDIIPNQVYSISAAPTIVAIDFRFIFYDENNNFISGVADTLGDNFGWHRTVTSPDNASKVRISSAKSTRDLIVVNIGSEPMGEVEGGIWDGGFWDGIPTPPLRDGSVREQHLSTELRGKIASGGGSGDGGTGGSGGDLGVQHIYDDSSVYSSGQEKTIADVENKSVVDLIEFSSNGILSELQIFYKENDGTEFSYDLISNNGTDSVPNTFENMQLHGSPIAEFIEFDDRNNVYKVNTKDLKFANGFLIKVKNNDSVEKNISVRVVSRQYV